MKACITVSLLDCVQRLRSLNVQIFFTRVRACLLAGLKRRERERERERENKTERDRLIDLNVIRLSQGQQRRYFRYVMYVTGREGRWTSESSEALCRPRAGKVWHYITLPTRRISDSSLFAKFGLKRWSVLLKIKFTEEPLNTICHGKLKSSHSTPFKPKRYIEVTQSL